MLNENFGSKKELISNFLLSCAADIDTCVKSLVLIDGSLEDMPSEYSLLLLVKEKLDNIQKQINKFDTENI